MANSLPSNASDLTLTQIASKGCDVINSQVAAHVFANTAMKNIYQGEIEKGGRGVSQEYSNDTTGSSITVIRPLPLPIKARELGKSINGGNFSAFDYQPSSDSYTLQIITVIDDVVDIPGVSLDMIPVGIASMYVQNISDKVVLNMNALKVASAMYTSFSQAQADSSKANIITRGADSFMKDLMKTYVQLDKGDKANGVSMFPQNDRIGLLSVDSYADALSANGVFSLGGANYAYDILRKGTVEAGAEQDKLADGYVGDLFGIPFHTVSPLVLETACEYLGFDESAVDGVLSIVKSAHGNLFALASGSSIKTVDSPNGQGIRLQPLYRMGCACIMPKANSFLVSSSWVNPYKLKSVFSSGITWGYTAPGSRSSHSLALSTSASTKLTATDSGAVAIKCVISSTEPVESVANFVSLATASNASVSTLTSGTEATINGFTSGKYALVCSVSADGTTVVKSIKQE